MAYAVSKEVSCKSRLQRSYDKQILTPAALDKFCEESIPNMNFNFQETKRMRQRRETERKGIGVSLELLEPRSFMPSSQ